jgi:hypothetical protein
LVLIVNRKDTERIEEEANADYACAAFILGLRPQSLRYFEVISSHNIAERGFLALCSHSESLKELRLRYSDPASTLALSSLAICNKLETILLVDESKYSHSHPESVEFMTAWFQSCEGLKDIELSGIFNGPEILNPLLDCQDIKLERISVDGYNMVEARPFHSALSRQRGLTSIYLNGSGEGVFRDDIDTLVDSLSRLKSLRSLKLGEISDYFKDSDITHMALNLKELEVFETSGYGITNDVLPAMSSLKNLRNLSFNAMTSFTYDGIQNFISSLRPTNRGLLLQILNAEANSNLPEGAQYRIRKSLQKQVDGQFIFAMNRGSFSPFLFGATALSICDDVIPSISSLIPPTNGHFTSSPRFPDYHLT